MSKILKNYLYKKVLSRFSVFLIDILIIIFSCIFMFVLRFGFQDLTDTIRADGMMITFLLVLFNTVFFIIFRTFSGILRFSSFSDLLRIVYALSLGYGLAFLSAVLLLDIHIGFTLFKEVFFATYVLNVLLMVFSRVFVKEIYEALIGTESKAVNVFVYGTKETGISVAKALKANSEFNFKVLGFISDEQHMIGKDLLGVNIYANNDRLFRILESKDVKTIIISPQKMEEIKDTNMLSNFVDHNISLMTTPPISEWNGSLTSRAQLKDIQIEDLLLRDPIKINMMQIASDIQGRRILVTGAAGSIGSEIVRQVAKFNPFSVTLIDQAETPLHDIRLELQEKWRNLPMKIVVADITNASRMENIFREFKPHYIFHAAAYKHVPMMEDNVSESVQTNINGTKILADLAVKYGADKFVMISTDKAVNPSNVMGCSKRICEIYVQSLAKYLEKTGRNKTQFITTRFGNVLGSNGSVIPLFKEQIKKGGP
ncbi:MAG TPA: polysaccharide biosynthesis protein, partial [Porphyromonadaceae bacterium]|nr:polysaccharide biosynthesis protein [Porphyromonadaceae bacterium]